MVESTEPTNIIWENRHFTAQDYIKRTVIVFGIIFFLLCVSLALIFFCKMLAIEKANKYPAVDCDDVADLYTYDKMGSYAYREYKSFYDIAKGEESVPFTGVLQCHCEHVSKTVGSGSGLINYLEFDKNNENGVKICEQYVYDKYITLVYGQSVSYMIIAINYILRLFIIKLIIYIGKDTESEQTRLITNGVFIVQFFNTAMLLLSVNANLSE